MSLITRSTFRAIGRSLRASRSYSTAESGASYAERQAASKAHAESTTDLWRRISFYICVPALIVGGIHVYKLEKEHAEHLHHILEENDGVLPHAEYEYLHRRVKPFPWGMNPLFYHKQYNKNMELEE